MDKLPTASIIVALHNSENHVGALVAALQAQEHAKFEAILVNDASTDNTMDAALAATQGDARFRIVSLGQNRGPGVARNEGMAAAHGDYLFFVDHDDHPHPQLLARVLERAAQAALPDIVCFRAQATGADDGQLLQDFDTWSAAGYSPVFEPRLHGRNLFGNFRNWPWDKAFRREFLLLGGISFPALFRTEDLAFTCAALASASRIALLDQVLYTYRAGAQGSSTATRDAHERDFFDSCLELKRFLASRGLSQTYEQTYTAWVGLCCAVNLVELRTPAAFEAVFDLLTHGGLAELGISSAAYARAQGSRTDAARSAIVPHAAIDAGAALASVLGTADERLAAIEVAGRYRASDIYHVLAAIEGHDRSFVQAFRAQLPAEVSQRTRAWYQRKGQAEQRKRELAVRTEQYVHDFGPLLGPILRAATQPLHDAKHRSE